MDTAERGSFQSEKDSKQTSKKHTCAFCWKVILIFAFLLALAACILSLFTFALQVWSLKQGTINSPWKPVTPEEEQNLLNEVATVLFKSEYNSTGRSKRTAPECTSDYDYTLSVKPSAHIVGKTLSKPINFPKKNFFETYIPVLSANLSCDSGRNGHVVGGMKYNEASGFLQVPTDGIYFIYSQILISTDDSSASKLGHMTVKCSCEDICNCYDIQNYVSYNDDTFNIMNSYSGSAGSNYHGGLFHLKAGSYVGVIAVKPKSGSINMVAENSKSFFGGYFVTGLSPIQSPSPTPFYI